MTKRQEWQEICRIPKWAQISLVVFSALAIVLLVGAFALQKWAGSQVENANLVLSKIDKNKSTELESKIESSVEFKSESNAKSQIYAYEARVHFARLDFLLRSGSISRIDLQSVDWENGIDSSAIQSIETHNRRLNFTTTQKLDLDLGANLGTMSFKMDFSPLPKGITKYALTIIALFLGTICLYRFIALYESGKITLSFGEISLPQAIWSSYKNINPLYRHTFWIVFIACNIVFGFHTVQFLWGNHDWEALMYSIPILSEAAGGRYTQSIIGLFLQNGMLLPLLNNVLAFVGLAFASVWLCMYLNIQKQLWVWLIVSFILTLQPFTLDRMYYSFQVADLFIAVAVGILGFILAKKAGESSPNHSNNSSVSNSLSLSLSLVAQRHIFFAFYLSSAFIGALLVISLLLTRL